MTAEEILGDAIRQVTAAGYDVPNWLVLELIDRLPPRQAMAMRLRWVDRIRNGAEIARRMGCHRNKTRKHLANGYIGLAAAIVSRFPGVDFRIPELVNPLDALTENPHIQQASHGAETRNNT